MQLIQKKNNLPHWCRGRSHWTYMKRKRNRAHRRLYKQRLCKYDGVEEPEPLRVNETLTTWDIW